jgi:hypothetical protein
MNNQEQFKKLGYCVVKSAIDDNLRDFVTQYALFDEMQDFTPESRLLKRIQVPNAHSKYADPAMETMLLLLKEVLEKNTGLELHPTYSYYRVYRPGDELHVHQDREACEISATVCFNYSYDESFVWPLFIEGTPIQLNPGDMAIYKGCELGHWREKFSLGGDHWQVQGFFHYVDANGPNADCKFDSRSSIGEPPNITTSPKDYIQYVN